MPLVLGGRGLSVLFYPTMSILHLSRSLPSGRRSLLSVSSLPEALRCAADIPDERATNPSSGAEAAQQMIANFENVSGGSGSGDNESYDDAEDTPEIKAAKAKQLDPDDFTYTERDVMLYNLGVGAKADELHLTYENAEGFAVCQLHPYMGHADIAASTDLWCHSPIRFFIGSAFRFVRTQLQPNEASSRRTIPQAQQGSIPNFRYGPELGQARRGARQGKDCGCHFQSYHQRQEHW
jgi:hypothetical protein